MAEWNEKIFSCKKWSNYHIPISFTNVQSEFIHSNINVIIYVEILYKVILCIRPAFGLFLCVSLFEKLLVS